MTRLARTVAKGTPFEEVFKPEWIDDIKTEENRIEAIQILSKLKKYEDLEEELDCSLELVNKVRKLKKIYVNKYEFINVKEDDRYFKVKDIMVYETDTLPTIEFYYTLDNQVRIGFVLFRDYGKTWWLEEPKERMEEND